MSFDFQQGAMTIQWERVVFSTKDNWITYSKEWIWTLAYTIQKKLFLVDHRPNIEIKLYNWGKIGVNFHNLELIKALDMTKITNDRRKMDKLHFTNI